jgi:phosphinothricin acetyltransferase
MTHIRRATAADLPAILELANHYAQTSTANFAIEPEILDDWQRIFDDTQAMHPWLIAVDDDEPRTLLGFAKSSPWKGRCAYSYAAEITVYIHPDKHGRGLGTALYDALLRTLAAQGYRSVLGGITQPNEPSVRLHEKFGMKRVALLERIGWKFDAWHDVGYWQGSLTDDPDAPPTAIQPVDAIWDGVIATDRRADG